MHGNDSIPGYVVIVCYNTIQERGQLRFSTLFSTPAFQHPSHSVKNSCNIEDLKRVYQEAEKPEQRSLNIHIIDPNVMEQGGMMNNVEKSYTER